MKNTSLQSSLQKELEKCKLEITKAQEKNKNLEKRIAEVIKGVCSIRVQGEGKLRLLARLGIKQ